MGTTASKKVHQGDNESNTLVQNPNSFVEKSSGFHMIEIHLPSLGMSMTAFIVLLLLFAALFAAYRRYVRKQEQRRILHAYYRRGLTTDEIEFRGSNTSSFQGNRVIRQPNFAPPQPPLPRIPRRTFREQREEPPRYSRSSTTQEGQSRGRVSCPCSDSER